MAWFGAGAGAVLLALAGCSLEPEMPSVRVQLVAQNSPSGLAISLAEPSLGGLTSFQTPAEFFVEPGATLTLTLSALPPHKEIEAWLLDGEARGAATSVTVTVDEEATITLRLNSGLLYRLRADGSGDFPNLQQAIAGASSGDILDLAAGTYTGGGNRNLDFAGKALRVRAPAGPAATVLDLTGTMDDQGLIFQSGEGPGTAIQGITVRGALSQGESGMGVQCIGTSPTFTDCVFSRCAASPGGMGGGVLVDGGSPMFTSCVFDSCGGAFGGGGAWVKTGHADFLNCLFRGNVVVQPGSRGGGGMLVDNGASATATGCMFERNKSRTHGAGISSYGFVDAVDCVFLANDAEDAINSRGGGFFGDGFVEGCIFRLNEAGEGGGVYLGGTGIFPPARPPVVSRCTIVGNIAGSDGGGLLTNRSENTIDHTIVAFNTGGAGASDPDQATVECCDFFGNSPSNTSGINVGAGANFVLDPKLCNLAAGDLTLSATSPCLPANNPGCSITVGARGSGCP
jgi:hypothetical protein